MEPFEDFMSTILWPEKIVLEQSSRTVYEWTDCRCWKTGSVTKLECDNPYRK